MSKDANDYAPPEWIRWSETFWSLRATEFDRSQDLIELGAGRGEVLLRLSPFIGTATGYEADPAELAVAIDRLRGKRGLRAEAFDGADPPAPDASCDVVFIDLARPGAVLADRPRLFAAARRLLRPEGRLLALAFSDAPEALQLRDAWTRRLAEIGKPAEKPPDVLSSEAAAAELAAAGFEVSVVRTGPALLALEGLVPAE